MFPLLSRSRRAFLTIFIAVLLYFCFEKRILLFTVGSVGRLWDYPALLAVGRAGQIGDIANPVIISALDCPSRELVLSGCRAVSRCSCKGAVLSLIRLLRSNDPEISRAAGEALKSITGRNYSALDFSKENREKVLGLVDVLVHGDPSSARTASLELARIGLPALAHLLELLRTAPESSGASRIALVLETLSKIGCGMDANDIFSLLSLNDTDIRRAAERALIGIGQEAVPVVMAGLDAPNYWTFISSVRVLARIAPERTARQLISRLETGFVLEASRKRNYVEALGILSTESAKDCLLDIVRSSSDGELRVMAFRALDAYKGERVLDVIAGAVNDPDPAVRQEAIRALTARKSRGAFQRWVGRYLSGDLDPREQAIIERSLSRGAGNRRRPE